jgi:MoaA/NifB/PqqE/SkfB family radical SAM enzyme
MKEVVGFPLNNFTANLQDEYAISKALKKSFLLDKTQIFPLTSLRFELTSHCNVICKHCYNNSGQNSIHDAMTPEKWISFAEYLVEHGGVFECDLSGGEPLLLGDSLFKMMDVFHDDGSCFMLLTNGYLLTDDIAKKLKKYRYHWLQISIDSVTSEYHDSFRQKKGSWEKAVNAAKNVVKNNIPLKIAHCISPLNLDTIDEMCSFAFSLGASSIVLGEICLSGRAADNQELLLSDDQRQNLYQKIKENYIRYKDRMIIKSSNSVRKGLEKRFQWSRAGAVIRPNGDIRIDGMAPFVIGNILREDFSDVWKRNIDVCWSNPAVLDFISGFNDEDRNTSIINYVDDDVYIGI